MLIGSIIGLLLIVLYSFVIYKLTITNKIHYFLYYKTPEWLKLLIIGILLVCSYYFLLDILKIENSGLMMLRVVVIGTVLGLIFRKPKQL